MRARSSAGIDEQASGVAQEGVAGSGLDPGEAGETAAVDSGEPAQDGTSADDALALGVALATLLGPDAERLLAAWREVSTRAAGLAPSEASRSPNASSRASGSNAAEPRRRSRPR